MTDPEDTLSDVLSEFAQTMITDFPIQGILDRLVNRIVDLLPITAAGVTLITLQLSPHYLAASNALALQFERLQSELRDGPCVVAFSSGAPVAEPDLASATRFPKFAAAAVEAGLAAVFAFPIRHGDQPLGALDLYRDTPGALDEHAMRTAQTLADVAAAYLLNARLREERQHAADVAHHQYLHDNLTGLPNRALLLERLQQAFSRSRRTGAVSAVLFVDLDDFKSVNDRFGHAAGDELLICLAARLASLMRPSDTVARLHGDEFVILCEDLHDPDEAGDIARRIDEALSHPFVLGEGSVSLTASVGVALADRHTHAPEEVLRNADTAMYEAKRKRQAPLLPPQRLDLPIDAPHRDRAEVASTMPKVVALVPPSPQTGTPGTFTVD